MSELSTRFYKILISFSIITVIAIVIIFYFLLIPKKSNLVNQETSPEQNKKIMIASVILYNNYFAGKEKGSEDHNWNKNLYNHELDITLDEQLFQNTFIIPDNIVNGKWVKLIIPKF